MNSINTFQINHCWLVILVLIGISCNNASLPSQASPNIILIFTDDHRSSSITNPVIIQPNIDSLRSSGVFFPNAHTLGSYHGALCIPSRAMLMTSQSLNKLERQGFLIPDEHKMMGEHLQEHGYDTYGIGKWHNDRSAFNRNFNGGDAIFFGGMHDHWNAPLFHYHEDGNYENRRLKIEDPFRTNVLDTLPGEYAISGKHSSEIFADAAIQYIKNRPADQPFFLYVAFSAPHDPRTAPTEYMDLYDPEQIKLPPNFMPKHPFDNGELVVRDELLAGMPRGEEEIKRHIAEYYGIITHMDEQIGRIRKTLSQEGITDNTYFILLGDNGLSVGQHGLVGKQSLYQHSMNVPLLINGPDVPQGVERSTFCNILDMFPTICDLLDVDPPANLDGYSLVPALQDDVMIRDVLHFQYRHQQAAMRKGNDKWIRYAVDGDTTYQLFDLEKDPWELSNLVEDNPTLHQRMREEFTRWERDHRLIME